MSIRSLWLMPVAHCPRRLASLTTSAIQALTIVKGEDLRTRTPGWSQTR